MCRSRDLGQIKNKISINYTDVLLHLYNILVYWIKYIVKINLTCLSFNLVLKMLN